MSNKEIQTYSFWSLLQKYSIEVPKIQRDYAQGRENRKTEIIRNNLVTAFFNAIEKKDNENLNLDFIYGSIDANNKLTPLDGQQRLTTLFLLHWYLATISGNLNIENKNTLLKFTYETRLSSRRFCDALVSNEVRISNTTKLSSQISDTTWFYFTWKKDPTIKAMLTMLDTIHTKFKGQLGFWDQLINNNPIEFEFLPLNKFNLSDELYVKMNARGKALSDFENFKSWLDEKLELKTSSEFKKDWSLKLDTIWTDLFWNNDDKDNSIDEEMISFFRGIAMFNYIELFEVNDKNRKEFEKRVAELNDYNQYISNEEFETLLFKEIETVTNSKNNIFESINCFLDFYYNNEENVLNIIQKIFFWNELDNNIFLQFIQKPTYSQRILFFGLFKYILKHKGNSDTFTNSKNEFIRFFRILRNLVENSEITPTNIKNVLISIDKLVNSENILTFLSDKNIQLQGLDGMQVTEEQQKATLILQNNDWETEIIKAENHLFFKGNIGFIIEFSESNLEKFKNYFNILELIFDKDGNKFLNKNIFQRALLTKGDYTKNGYKLLNSVKEWKFYLKQSFDKLDNLKKLLDDNSINLIDLSNSFQDIIDNYLSIDTNINKYIWRFNLIKHPIIWSVSEYKYLRRNPEVGDVSIRRKERNHYNDNLPINSFREIILSKLLDSNSNFKLIQPSDKLDINFQTNRIVKSDINFYKNDWVGICLENSEDFFPVIYFHNVNSLEFGIRKKNFKINHNKFELKQNIIDELNLEFLGDENVYWEYYKFIDYSKKKK